MGWMQIKQWERMHRDRLKEENRMQGKKKHKNIDYRMQFRFAVVIAVAGIVVMGILFGVLTWREQREAVGRAQEMKNFLHEHVEQYNTNVENDKAKSLYNLADRMKELGERLAEKNHEGDMDKFLKKYRYEQRLDGIILTDADEKPVFQTGKNAYRMWKNELADENIRQIISYPEKTYMTLTEKKGEKYFFTAVARTDEAGIIVGYRRKFAGSMNSTITPEKLFYGYTFERDGIVAVAEEDMVLSSNSDQLTGRKVKDCPVLTMEGNGSIGQELVRIRLGGQNLYRGSAQMNGYTLYVIYPEKQIYMSRAAGMLGGLILYILLVFCYLQIRSYYRRQQERMANTAKTDFLRRMSHDIRTPINGIRGMVPICKHYTGNPEKQNECLDKILAASGFLLDLVNDVLDMNKLESRQIELEEKTFELSAVMDEVTSVIGMQAAERGIEFSVEMCYCKHNRLIGSPLHLSQILQNIFSNAVKYNKDGGNVWISYEEKEQTKEQSLYEFVCRDTGLGMSREFQMQAYEPFSQEKNSARTSYEGTGLGLAISKNLVDQMGGSIRFESEENKGTTFYISIPFRLDTSPVPDTGGAAAEQPRIDGMRILLAEDNDLNMEVAEFMLESAGAVVTKAWNGKEACRIFEQSEPYAFDVVLMDIMMPEMDGLDAVRKIRQMERKDAAEMPVIAMSANAFSDDVKRSLDAGMNAHISKPLDVDRLVEILLAYCGRKEDK